MKIRIGFVSNSSSSSFLVALPKNDFTPHAGDLKELLFGTDEFLLEPYHKALYGTGVVAEVIAKDLQAHKLQKKYKFESDFKDLSQKLENDLMYCCPDKGYGSRVMDLQEEFSWIIDEVRKNIPSQPEYPEYTTDETLRKQLDAQHNKQYKLWEKIARREAKKLVKKILAKAKKMECDLYLLEYGDHDGNFYCALEHGGVFKKVPHIRFSHH